MFLGTTLFIIVYCHIDGSGRENTRLKKNIEDNRRSMIGKTFNPVYSEERRTKKEENIIVTNLILYFSVIIKGANIEQSDPNI